MCFGVLGCGEVGWRAQLHNWPREEYRSVSEDGWRWQAGASPGPGQDAGFILGAVKRSIGSTTGCTIMEKATTRAFS